MDIRQLKYFVTVVEEKTVTAAAKQLHMTQPPLTAQLHMLEDELGCKLFSHEGRRLYLTEAGNRLYVRALEILGMCDSVVQEMADFRQGIAGTLRIGVISSVQGTLFADWMKEYQSRYPDVNMAIYSGNTYDLLDRLQNRQIDLAIVRTPFSGDGLDILHLQREHILAVGHSSFFQDVPGSEITIPQLAPKPLIIYRRWQRSIESSFESAGCRPRIYCINDGANLTLLLTQLGMGVGLLHPSALPCDMDRSIEIRIIQEESLTSEIDLACQNKRQLPQTARLFWQMLQEKRKASYDS